MRRRLGSQQERVDPADVDQLARAQLRQGQAIVRWQRPETFERQLAARVVERATRRERQKVERLVDAVESIELHAASIEPAEGEVDQSANGSALRICTAQYLYEGCREYGSKAANVS